MRWWGPDQVAGGNVLVTCATVGSGSDGLIGGYVAFDGSNGTVEWSDIRAGQIGDAGNPPDVSPDGTLALLFLSGEGTGPSYRPSGGLVVDTSTGDEVARGTFMGGLAYDGWFAQSHVGGSEIRFERLAADDVIRVERPCGCSYPLAVLPAGVLWMGRDPETDREVFQYSPMDGSLVVEFPSPAGFVTSLDPAITPHAVILGALDSPRLVAVG